jgi:site-specific DNA-methyltransferase (adenine-specific)
VTEGLRLHLADCVEAIPRLVAAGSVDAVVTSPPYNLGIRYGAYDDSAPRERYLEWTDRWVRVVAKALAPGGSLFLNVGGKPSDPWGPLDVALVVRRHLTLQNTIHWIKSIAIDRGAAGTEHGLPSDLAVGHYKPIRGERFLNDCHEYIFHFTHGGGVPLDRLAIGVPYQDKSNVTRWRSAGGDRRCRGNTWFIPYDTIKSREKDRPHPATFPPRLPELCLRLHGLGRIRLVLDPFLGIGHTAVACARLRVPFIGFEIDPDYFREAHRRAEEAALAPSGEGGVGRAMTVTARRDHPRQGRLWPEGTE